MLWTLSIIAYIILWTLVGKLYITDNLQSFSFRTRIKNWNFVHFFPTLIIGIVGSFLLGIFSFVAIIGFIVCMVFESMKRRVERNTNSQQGRLIIYKFASMVFNGSTFDFHSKSFGSNPNRRSIFKLKFI